MNVVVISAARAALFKVLQDYIFCCCVHAFHCFVHVIVSMFSIGHDIHNILLYRYAYFDGLGHCDELEM